MKLSAILSKIKTSHQIASLKGEVEISDVALDSRLVKKNSIFFAMSGKTQDGANFIASAVANGASAVVISQEEKISAEFPDVILIKTSDVFSLLIEFLKIFYPNLPANIYAITGTNGKTSSAEFTRQILQFLGKKSASIGTLGAICDSEIAAQLQSPSLTTPDVVSLYKNLATLKNNGVDDVAIEVSSIGLEQKRIAGLKISIGAFTNFTQDHLDYHVSMAEYFRCKMILFSEVLQNGVAVLNADIPEFEAIKKICNEKNHRIIEYGFKARDLRIKKISALDFGQRVSFEFGAKDFEFDLAVSGEFQALNALCALGNILAKNEIGEENLRNLLKNFHKLQPAAGRMQRVATLKNQAQIFIDFAHSPDALENVLKLAHSISKARIVVLFGCGGNRDAKKRPVMGQLASSLADLVIVTDDNPRNENPQMIRHEILAACDMKKTIEIENRKLAIEKAISLLQACDILILAGKGHEKYQIIGDKKFEFDEEKIVKNVIAATS